MAAPALTVLFDVKSPWSLLALEPTLALLAEQSVQACWEPLLVAPLQPPGNAPAADAPRGDWHRYRRARYRIDDLRRYGEAQGLPERCFADDKLFAGVEGRAAAAVWLACAASTPEQLRALFHAWWLDDEDPDSLEAMAAVLVAGGESLGDLSGAEAALEAHQLELRERGCFDVPGYLIDDTIYYGRQHLPMVGWHLTGCQGPPPVFYVQELVEP